LGNGLDESYNDYESTPITPDTYLAQASVLVIDDDETTLFILQDLLELSGLQVVTTTDGREGISLFQDRRSDLVISDIRMPHMDGLEVLRKIREIDDTVSVILVTGHGDLDYALRALRRGAYDFLLKPINVEILVNTVRKGIDHCRLKRFERDYRQLLEEQVKARTKELAETNEFLKGILNSSASISIVLTDFDRKVIFWNAGAENIYGYTAEEMVGSSITRLYPEDMHETGAMDELRRVMCSKRGTVNANVKQVSKDGRSLTISLTVSAMRDATDRVRGILGLGQDVTEKVRLHQELVKSYQRIRRIQGASIFALARLAESRDGETGYHLNRMQAYCKILCNQLTRGGAYQEQMDDQFVEDLIQVSVLHDIGKVAMPDSILFNPRKFGDDEFEVMKQHSVFGGCALEDAANEAGQKESYLFLARDIAYYHHEKWDGSGYPFGLRGEEIPLGARIVAVADVYDALTTERRYKRSYSHEEARRIIVADSGNHFDPALIDAFLECEDEFEKIRSQLS
jgi:putative two-component system response regulator